MILGIGRRLVAVLAAGLALGVIAPRAEVTCAAPDHYLVPKTPLRHSADAMRAGKPLRVLVYGALKPQPLPSGGLEPKRYPAILSGALTSQYPKISVAVDIHADAPMDIVANLRGLRETLATAPYDLVIWQIGASDVMRGTDMGVFGARLSDGISAIRGRQADVVLMTLQYSPRTDFLFDAGPYLQYLKWAAKTGGASVFNRYDVMRYWSEDGTFDLSQLQPGASMFEDVHRCVGQLLARFIANGIAAASESQ